MLLKNDQPHNQTTMVKTNWAHNHNQVTGPSLLDLKFKHVHVSLAVTYMG